MGCGCKNKKKKLADSNNGEYNLPPGVPNSKDEIENRRNQIVGQSDYQNKVRDALKQLMALKQKKRKVTR
tara:strand:- start:48 stop:257 length:210 start_codon:yes stop_codon:yes gene_type:complete